MTYKHGSFVNEVPTAVLPPLESQANLTFIVGVAPIHLTDESNVNKLQRITNLEEYVKLFGYDPDFSKYTLAEAADVFFRLYSVTPIYMVNVLDPAVHKVAVSAETHAIVGSQAILTQSGAIKSSVVVKVATVTKVLDTDYTLAYNKDNKLVVTVLADGSIEPTDTLSITYNKLDVSLVSTSDVIGGYSDGSYTGISLADQVYPKFNEILGSLIAPKYCKTNSVAAILATKASAINAKFRANAIIDLNTSTMTSYADAISVKQQSGLVDSQINLCVGDLMLSGVRYNQSVHLAALKQLRAAVSGNVPYTSPSNKNYVCDGYQINGANVYLDDTQAEYLNANGMIVAINETRGWLCWGNRTAAFPGTTDIKDIDIAVRDMTNWVANTITTYQKQFVDGNINRRMVQTQVDSINIWLNGLVRQEKLLSGRIVFSRADNPDTDLLAGKLKYKVYHTPAPTATEIVSDLEYDVSGLSAIFG